MLTSLYLVSLTVLLTFLIMFAVDNIQTARKRRKKAVQNTDQVTPALELHQQG
ncbi:hypothetical protein [Halobacillus sp. Marseille-Q1614]|uniref:hypothetical protein n=1 Tax=Halobacillus sp. Marseille-Q1614 TaxID=2709134 RepID=UPI00156E8C44|nr:hypothetical protein [Halobacillus sp. Marseille-Q1614]